MTMRTAIAKVRGLGSSKSGVGHFKLQRLTAMGNVLLLLWFLYSVVALSGASYEETVAWLASPISAALMLLLVVSSFWHAKLGAQVVIEDYVHDEGVKILSLTAMNFAILFLGAISVVSILQVATQG